MRFFKLMNKGTYISIFVLTMMAYLLVIAPPSALASSEETATPNIQIGTNPNDADSSGLFIGIKDIKDSNGALVPNAKLAGYQIELSYDHSLVKVLDAYDEALLGHFTVNNGTNLDITSIADVAYPGTSQFDKLMFVPLALTGTANDSPQVTIHFKSLSDSTWNPITVPDVVLPFQRGKIANEASSVSPDIVDAIAGLQYLSNFVAPGFEQGQVNVVNMASILPPAVGATVLKPSVKNVVSLMQYLVGLRDDSFRLDQGPAQVSISPNTIDSEYTTPAAISVTGTSTHFASGVTKLRILNSSNQAMTGNSTLTVQNNTKATINLAPGLGAGVYTVELTTDSEVLVATLKLVYPGLTFSLNPISPTSFKVTFNHALEDPSNVLFTVQNTGTFVSVTTTWNATNTEATLTSSSNFPKGTYTIAVKDGTTELGESSVETQKLAQIKITSSKLATTITQSSSGVETQLGYATYAVLDQYGNDITNSYLANNVSFTCGVGSLYAKNGLITIMPLPGINLNQLNEIVIVCFDPTSGIAASATLTTSTSIGTLSDIKLNTLTNADNKVLTAGDMTSTWYIDYTATDVSGNPTKDYLLVTNGLILGGNVQLMTSSPYVSAAVVQDPKDSTKAVIQVTVSSAPVLEDIPVSITAMTWSGEASSLNVILKKQATVDTFTLKAPDSDISVGETTEIPFEAKDQYGNAVTQYSDLVGWIIFSSGSPIQLQANTDGTLKLLAGPFTVSGPQTISAMTTSGKLSTITLDVHSNQVAAINIPSTKLVLTTNSAGAQQGYATYQVLDRYGNDITRSYPSNSLSFQSEAGSILAQQGVLTLTPNVGTDLQPLTTVLITAKDLTTEISTNATLSTSLGTLSDLQLNTLTNPDNKVLTAGDNTSTWYIDYTATDLSGNPTKDYNLVKEGLILGQMDDLTTSSPLIKAHLVQDPSDSSKAVIQVTPSNGLITADLPVSISALTCTGKITTLNITLKKQSTVDTFTLMPPAYEIASSESEELPFAAYDQNGVQLTKYADLAGGVTITGAFFTVNPDGTAVLRVLPVVNYTSQTIPLTITAVTSTGKISKLTLNIQKPARADSLTLDTSGLVSAMQSGAVQSIDCGYDYGGLTVKDQYGRLIDMTSAPGTYQVQAFSSDPSCLTVSSTSGAPGTNPAAYGSTGIRIEANRAGTGTVRFQLVDTQYPNLVMIDQKSVTFSVLPNNDIKGYTMNTVTAPIYATCTTGSAITDQQSAYEANPYVYGLTSSGSKVLLAGTPIIGVSVDNPADFRVDDYSGTISTSNPLPYNEVRVAANVLATNVTTSSAILTVNILGADGVIHSLITPLHSSMAPPVASSLSLSVDTSLPGISVSEEGDTVTLSLAQLQAYGLVTGNYLTRYDQLGSRQNTAVYFYAEDQYGTKGVPIAQVVQVGTTPGFSVDSHGRITCTPETMVPGSSAVLTASTNNGLVKTLQIHFIN